MRRKLVAVVLIPTIATVALAGTRIAVSVGAARDYDRVVAVAKLAGKVTNLVHALQDERDVSAGFVNVSRAKGGNSVSEARAATDREVTVYRNAADGISSGYSNAFTKRLSTVSADLDGLAALRTAVDTGALRLNTITAQYAAAIGHLLDIDANIAEEGSDNDLATAVRSLDDLSRAIEFESQNRAQLYAILSSGSFMVGQFEEYAGFAQRAQSAADQFRTKAAPDDRAQYAATLRGTGISNSNLIRDTTIQEQRAEKFTSKPGDWYESQSQRLALMRKVESQNDGGDNMLARLLGQTEDLSSTARRDALIASIELLGVLLLAGIGTIVIARSMTGPLRILRTSALEVADHRLPEVIERLRQADTGNLDDITVTPTGIDSGDEIGEVAQAFDAVHREAVRLAVDQASLRQSVNAMFVNLSRRSQGLVERQLRLIDELESSEQNPDQLENLFKLDHLATRMRRNDDSLLVLAGSETGRGWNQPMSLPDVVLASISEVEQYTRITRTTVTEAGLVGYVVSDVVHLLAELMENATAFSPPETTVTVSSRKLSGRGGAMIEIEDHGIGMTPEELDAANARLAAPPVIDVAVVRTMGLFVVGRLANKHNIRVQLRNSPRSGVTALVLLPPSLITDLNPDSSAQDSDSGRLGSRTPYDQEPQYPPPQSYEQSGMTGSSGQVGTDTGPMNLEPSPIFDSVSEWFRHRRRIDHEAVQENPTPTYPKRGPMGTSRPQSPPAPPQQQQQQRQVPPPRQPQRQAQQPQQMPQQQSPQRRAPQQQPPQQPQPQQRRSPQAMPDRQQSAPPQAAPPNGQPGGLPRRGPNRRPGNPAATSAALPRPALPQQPSPARPAQPQQQMPQSIPPPPTQRQQQVPQMSAPEGDIAWSTPADEGWKVAQATSSPSFERTTHSGLPVRTPRAHLFPGSASTAREERRTPAPKPPTDRSPDSVRSLLSTYYSSYKRGRTDEADPNSGKHRANFGFPSPDEQEGS